MSVTREQLIADIAKLKAEKHDGWKGKVRGKCWALGRMDAITKESVNEYVGRKNRNPVGLPVEDTDEE